MLKGSIVALITPMNKENKIDLISLKKLINYHILSKTSSIVVLGTTGEASTLNQKEFEIVVMKSLEFSQKKIPIIIGNGSNSTVKSIEITKKFNNSGIAGFLNVTPYYNCPNQEGLYQHFKSISENTDLPQIIYNVPSRTGCDLLPNTIGRLSKIKNIIAIKEATGNLTRVNQIKQVTEKNFLLLSGDDSSSFDFMKLGGHGVISVTANIAAKEMVDFCNLMKNNKYDEASNINNQLMPLHKKLFFEPNPIPVKWACKFLNLISDENVRLPMIPLDKDGKEIIKEALVKAKLFKN